MRIVLNGEARELADDVTLGDLLATLELHQVRYAVEVHCPAEAIPEAFTADLTGLDIGDSVHISAITLPEGVTPTITDRDFTIATIAAPAVLQSEDEEAEEAEAAEAEAGEEAEGEAGGDEESGEE